MRSGLLRGWRLFAALVAPLALYGAAAVAQSTPVWREPARQGAIVRFEESRGSSILYLEESGGMASRAAPPAAKNVAAAPEPKAARAARPVVARAPTPEVDPARTPARRSGLADAVAARQ